MNANKLADKLEQGHWEGGTREQAATMLRQQAEQINNLQQWEKRQLDVLEALKKEAALQRLSDFTQEAEKTLTDEEIDAVGDEVSNLIDTYAGRREFARAILRKAQEK